MRKELGKIQSIYFGLGDRGDLGLHIDFKFGNASGVIWSESFWDFERVKRTETTVWTEEDREIDAIRILRKVSNILKEAKVDRIERLKDIPVELTFDVNSLVSWRVLTEVL